MECVEEQLDPRVQVELELLNTATDEINKLEAKLEDANNTFRTTLSESTERLKSLAKKLGGCIERARPYYEALELARSSQLDCQRAAVQYQRANALHQAAKETIAKAEEKFVHHDENRHFDTTWQEFLNRAIIKVMEAEAQKASSEREHLKRAATYQHAERQVQQLHHGLRSSIAKSMVYFEEKSRVQSQLDTQKEHVQQLQQAVTASKTSYAQSLRRLEQISEQIHEQRRCQLPREPGVGAELPPAAASESIPYPCPTSPPHNLTTQDEQYWENVCQKLFRLEATSVDHDSSADDLSEVGRERSVTGSSTTLEPTPDPTHITSQEKEVIAQSFIADSNSVEGKSNARRVDRERYGDGGCVCREMAGEGVGGRSGEGAEDQFVRRSPLGGNGNNPGIKAAESRAEMDVSISTRLDCSFNANCDLGNETKKGSVLLIQEHVNTAYQYPSSVNRDNNVWILFNGPTPSQSDIGSNLGLRRTGGTGDIEHGCDTEKEIPVVEFRDLNKECVEPQDRDQKIVKPKDMDEKVVLLKDIYVEVMELKHTEVNNTDKESIELKDTDKESIKHTDTDKESVELKGRLSPPPGQCQPSKTLCVIPEELERCTLPE